MGDFIVYGHGPGFAASFAWAGQAAVVIDFLAARVSRRWAERIVVTLVVAAIAAFAFLFPHLDTQTPLKGSDRDDAADIAVRAAAHGDYPFDKSTYVAPENKVSNLPGSLVIAAPFVAAGTSALQIVLALPLAAWVLIRRTRTADALVVSAGVLAASTFFWHEAVTGGGLVAEWLVLSSAALWLASRFSWATVGLVGFAFNFRTNSWSAMAGVVGSVGRRFGVARAVAVAVVLMLVQALLIVPFLLGGLDRFGPYLLLTTKFVYLEPLFSGAEHVLPAVATVLAGLAALAVVTRWSRPLVAVPASMAVSQLVTFGFLAVGARLAGFPHFVADNLGLIGVVAIPAAVAFAVDAESS